MARTTYLEQPVFAAAQRFAAEFEVVVAEDELEWVITLISPAPIAADLDRLVLAAAVDEMLLEFQLRCSPAPDEHPCTVLDRNGRLTDQLAGRLIRFVSRTFSGAPSLAVAGPVE